MCRHARLSLNTPHSRAPVHRAGQQVLARLREVERQDPGGRGRRGAGGAEGQVADVLALLHVVEGDDARVAGGGEEGAVGRECDGADGLCETYG